jgi:hypothetical protein
VKGAIDAFEKKLSPFRERKTEASPNMVTIVEEFSSLAAGVEGTDAAPTDAQQRMFVDYRKRLARADELWSAIKLDELPGLNHRLRVGGTKEMHVPDANEIRLPESSEGRDLP